MVGKLRPGLRHDADHIVVGQKQDRWSRGASETRPKLEQSIDETGPIYVTGRMQGGMPRRGPRE
jgi:hypothetical protein